MPDHKTIAPPRDPLRKQSQGTDKAGDQQLRLSDLIIELMNTQLPDDQEVPTLPQQDVQKQYEDQLKEANLTGPSHPLQRIMLQREANNVPTKYIDIPKRVPQ